MRGPGGAGGAVAHIRGDNGIGVWPNTWVNVECDMIKVDKLRELLVSTETSRVERTVSTGNMDKFQEAICAFSNDLSGSGMNGYLIIGAYDDGRPSGLNVTDELFQKIAAIRSDGNVLPLPLMTVEKMVVDGNELLVVEVKPSLFPPVKYRGRTFIRIGPRRDIATEAEERILIERRASYMASWDSMPCMGATMEDLDINLFLTQYLPQAIPADVLMDDHRDLKDKLASLRLYDKKNDCPTNAAMLLFGRNVRYYYPGAYIQHVQFEGVDNAAEIANQYEFEGNLLTVLPKLKTFVETSVVMKRPVPVSVLQEKIRTNYPQWAIRELLMNAVMHRDYQSNTPTKFYIYSDRLEIVNPGGLYGNARPENFPSVNDYRNPVIAEALKVLGYVNKFNRGIARVQKELLDNGNGAARFTIDKVTVFAVDVTNANWANVSDNVSNDDWHFYDFGALQFNDKSLEILRLCGVSPHRKKDLLEKVGVTNQTNNVRILIEPLLTEELIWPHEDDAARIRGVRYVITAKGRAYLEYLHHSLTANR